MSFEYFCSRINENFTLKELQGICHQLKLHVSGSKGQVTRRIVQYIQSQHPDCEKMGSLFVKIVRQINRRITNNGENSLLIPVHPSPPPSQFQPLSAPPTQSPTGHCCCCLFSFHSTIPLHIRIVHTKAHNRAWIQREKNHHRQYANPKTYNFF